MQYESIQRGRLVYARDDQAGGGSMLDQQNPRDPFDLRFLNAMIAHHEEGLSMAQEAMERLEHPELREMVQKMMHDQEEEVSMMRHHRQEWYGEKAA